MRDVCQIYIHQLSDEIIYIPLATQVISYNENLKKKWDLILLGSEALIYIMICVSFCAIGGVLYWGDCLR